MAPPCVNHMLLAFGAYTVEFGLKPNIAETFYMMFNMRPLPCGARLAADVPSAAIFVICARGVLAVPGAELSMIPLIPNRSAWLCTLQMYSIDTYHKI